MNGMNSQQEIVWSIKSIKCKLMKNILRELSIFLLYLDIILVFVALNEGTGIDHFSWKGVSFPKRCLKIMNPIKNHVTNIK
jgi:hypothetical protein